MAEGFGAPYSTVRLPTDRGHLLADLAVPPGARAIVVFAHGSGSGRQSPRNRFVAGALERSGLATLLLDLLTPAEAAIDEQNAEFRFDIPLLGRRLVGAIDWLTTEPAHAVWDVGIYGASTGGAAALIAAALRPERVHALVLRGARSDLAPTFVGDVRAPTLFVVGGKDRIVLEINRETARRMLGPHETTVVPEATHLFEEPGALELVAEATSEWFHRYLSAGPAPGRGAGPRRAVDAPRVSRSR